MSKTSFYQKIAKVQKAVGPIVKDSTNPHFKSSYFDINSLIAKLNPILEKENLLLVQPIEGGMVKSIIIDLDGEEQIISEKKEKSTPKPLTKIELIDRLHEEFLTGGESPYLYPPKYK